MMNSPLSVRAQQRVDIGVVAVLTALVVFGTLQIEPENAERGVDWLALVCSIVAAGSLVFWRRSAVLVAAASSIALSVYLARYYPPGPIVLPGPLAALALGYATPRRVAWMGVAAMLGVSAIGLAVRDEALVLHLLIFLGWGVAAVLAGQALAASGERAAAKRESLAHAQEQALANERLRIAQDVHDSVAHAMATINVQSGVAAHLVANKPEQAAVALEAIRIASRDALDELGTILGVLREPGVAAPLAPAAGLGQIAELVDRARDDGLTVSLEQDIDAASLSPSAGAAAYRAVQEALTNTRRHAGPGARVNVTIAGGDRGSLRVTVTDDGGQQTNNGHEPANSSGGFGLAGMRERVESSGGSLNAAPVPQGGFSVDATWPERETR